MVKNLYTKAEAKELKCWFKERPHIEIGYRIGQPVHTAAKSFFYFHNETMNVLSHLLPALYFTYQLFCIIQGTGCYSEFKSVESTVCCVTVCIS